MSDNRLSSSRFRFASQVHGTPNSRSRDQSLEKLKIKHLFVEFLLSFLSVIHMSIIISSTPACLFEWEREREREKEKKCSVRRDIVVPTRRRFYLICLIGTPTCCCWCLVCVPRLFAFLLLGWGALTWIDRQNEA